MNMNPSTNTIELTVHPTAQHNRIPARKQFVRLAREYVAAMDNYSVAIRAADEAPGDVQIGIAVERTNKYRADAYRGLLRCASEVLTEQAAA